MELILATRNEQEKERTNLANHRAHAIFRSHMRSLSKTNAVAVVGQDRRISLILHLSPDISLDMANSTRTPYLIAGHYEGGETTFMCPAVGSKLPVCIHSYAVANWRGTENSWGLES